ncbi:MAG TPA: CvpA family protein [Burkholderiales bacterium]|nr:CvpA family protein [Burkholderiales bacterium]
MNTFDFILLGILLVFVFIGGWRGFVREILSLVTWAAAILIGWLFADDVAGLYDALVQDDVVRRVLGFVTLFAVVFLLGMLVSFLANRYLLQKKSFRLGNTVLGGLFGAVRGGLVVTLVFLLAGVTSFPQRDWWREAVLSPYFERTALFASQYIPRDIARHIRYG